MGFDFLIEMAWKSALIGIAALSLAAEPLKKVFTIWRSADSRSFAGCGTGL